MHFDFSVFVFLCVYATCVVFLTCRVASEDIRERGVRAAVVTGRERTESVLVFEVADSVSHSAFVSL